MYELVFSVCFTAWLNVLVQQTHKHELGHTHTHTHTHTLTRALLLLTHLISLGMWEAQQNWNSWSSALSHSHVVMGTIVGSIVVFVVVVVGGVVYAIRRATRNNYDLIA